VCQHYLATGTTVLGDELHIICHCPAIKRVLEKFTTNFHGLTQLLDLPPFASFTPDKITRMVLGNSSSPMLKKDLQEWITEATPIYGQFAYALRIINFRTTFPRAFCTNEFSPRPTRFQVLLYFT